MIKLHVVTLYITMLYMGIFVGQLVGCELIRFWQGVLVTYVCRPCLSTPTVV